MNLPFRNAWEDCNPTQSPGATFALMLLPQKSLARIRPECLKGGSPDAFTRGPHLFLSPVMCGLNWRPGLSRYGKRPIACASYGREVLSQPGSALHSDRPLARRTRRPERAPGPKRIPSAEPFLVPSFCSGPWKVPPFSLANPLEHPIARVPFHAIILEVTAPRHFEGQYAARGWTKSRRPKPTRVLLRRARDSLYLQPSGDWTQNRETAREFASGFEAYLWAKEHNLVSIEVIIAFKNPQRDIVLMTR